MSITSIGSSANLTAARQTTSTAGLNNEGKAYLEQLRNSNPGLNIVVKNIGTDKQYEDFMFSAMGTHNSVAVPAGVINRMASDPSYAAEMEGRLSNLPDELAEIKKACEAGGSTVYAVGAVVDKDGKITYWAIGGDSRPREAPGSKNKEWLEKQLEEKREKAAEELRLQKAEQKQELIDKLINSRNDAEPRRQNGIIAIA
ncbi:DUF6033 family protein [Oxalobacter sp. OttesenSCG-928-P03]|nr:DUF6033 family protein [Oxalobacter sp. OttesenSCG-928-P03]